MINRIERTEIVIMNIDPFKKGKKITIMRASIWAEKEHVAILAIHKKKPMINA